VQFIFKFLGGPLDGETVVERLGKTSRPTHYYALTHHGRLGQRFRTASQYAIETLAREGLKEERPHRFQPHFYEVVERIQNKGVVLVWAEYVQPKGRSP